MATSYIQTNNRGSVSVTADGVKTYGALLNELFLLIDSDKVTPLTTLVMKGSTNRFYRLYSYDSVYVFTSCYNDDQQISGTRIVFANNDSSWKFASVTSGGVSGGSDTSRVPSNGTKFTIYY